MDTSEVFGCTCRCVGDVNMLHYLMVILSHLEAKGESNIFLRFLHLWYDS